jgi:2-dehydropantoate 2-reductase
MTRVCVFGAGAVGSFVAGHLAYAGACEVSVVARGPQLRAVAEQGIRILTPTREIMGRPFAATDTPATLPLQDIVVVTLKAVAQSPCAADIAALLTPGGHAVFAGNGIPWWWKHGLPGVAPLPLVDPGSALWRTLGPERALGCVIYSANELVAPGVVRNAGNNRWLLGEPVGGLSERLQRTVDLFVRAGLGAEASLDIRGDVWAKLLRNVPANSICALTRLPVDALADDPALTDMASRAIDEVVAIARAHGTYISAQASATRESLRHGGGSATTPFTGVKPSMLQDVLAGHPLEVGAILGQVQQLARETHTPCPVLDVLLPLLRGLDQCAR